MKNKLVTVKIKVLAHVGLPEITEAEIADALVKAERHLNAELKRRFHVQSFQIVDEV